MQNYFLSYYSTEVIITSSKKKEPVSAIEKTLKNYIEQTDQSYEKVKRSILELRQEMNVFKKEMADFKGKETTLTSKCGLNETKSERKGHNRETMDIIAEMRRQTAEINQKWGELSNRLGTLAEDFAAPNLPVIAEKYFGCSGEPKDFMFRRRRSLPGSENTGSMKEFDVIAVYPDYVFYNETKSTPRSQYIDEFVENIKQFFDYFPEYEGRKLIPIFSSLALDESVVKNCTKKGIYAMALKGDTMDLLNFTELRA